MSDFIKNILRMSVVALIVPGFAFGVQQQNPRGSNSARSASLRSTDAASSASIRRSATSVIARSAGSNSRNNNTIVTARPASLYASSVRSARPVVKTASVVRSATKPASVRSAVSNKKSFGKANVSRAASARATAVFNDVSKIGGGYANCRDAYATCMDQMCANANDTYRRCFCSDRFTDFRDASDKLDEALKMLAEFQNNNLNAVDKTAAEVNAMYTASDGETAIKRDTSASQKLLDSISDVLAGKKSSSIKKNQVSLGVLDFSGFSSFDDDVFGSGVSSSVFGSGSDIYKDISTLEGKNLYDNAMKQCSEITRESCGGDAMFNLARSAYSIMITQDCNAYEKSINAKKASVEETVRTAEKYLREARLEEYRAHNSQDVNDCLSKVENAIRQPTACGPKYEKCLDYTGKYINSSTGEPVYSQALFGLNKLITLSDTADVLGANAEFDKWLDDKKIFAGTALDSCRSIADIVWKEFKRSAIIQIAQAQDEKIQEVKDSCVETIKECYDKQTGNMLSMDTTETQGTAAIAAATARGMCYDRVQACAALYGDPNGCVYVNETKKLDNANGKTCGLQSLLTFVDTIDSVKFAEGCESVLKKYIAEICPEDKDNEIKYGGVCAGKDAVTKDKLRAALNKRMEIFCPKDLIKKDNSSTISDASAYNTNIMNQLIKNIYDELQIGFSVGCEDEGGSWISAGTGVRPSPEKLYQNFYTKYYGTTIATVAQMVSYAVDDHGWCITKNLADSIASGKISAICEAVGGTWKKKGSNEEDGECDFAEKWYIDACKNILGGEWNSKDGGSCEVNNLTQENMK